ncbi:C39 family peptidase [Actinoplanes sp. CA-030573]|uniref:C39 family peptidase n=1 Tax=Actinoplanes sp. CA-030573 TaxID=3239898 RepID=UPI003D913842
MLALAAPVQAAPPSPAGPARPAVAAVRQSIAQNAVSPRVAVACSATFRCSTPLSGQVQQEWNWCGPASATTVLTNWAVPGVAQSWVASRVGIDKYRFALPTSMDNAINEKINAYYGQTLDPYSAYSGITNDNLWNSVRGWVSDFDEVFIVAVYAHKIWYPNAGTGVAHYLVIYGYSDQAQGYMVWDPAAGSLGGSHHLGKNDWERVAYPGRWVIAPNYF